MLPEKGGIRFLYETFDVVLQQARPVRDSCHCYAPPPALLRGSRGYRRLRALRHFIEDVLARQSPNKFGFALDLFVSLTLS